MTLLRFFHSGTVTIVPQLQRYNCSTLTLLRLFQLSRQILVPRMPRGRLFPTSSGQPLKIPFDHTGDVPIWCSRGVPKWRPGNFLIWHPRDVQRTFSGRPLEDFQNTSLGRCAVTYWMSLNFFLLFFRNLFDWPNLYKSNSVLKVYLEPSRTSKMELFFCEISEWLLSVNNFRERTSPWKFAWVLNTPLILSSNVIWHAYRPIPETKIFRLGVFSYILSMLRRRNGLAKNYITER